MQKDEASGEKSSGVLAGRYRLDAVIGSGSMGTVWRAWDEVVQRWVAIKQINLPPGMPEHEVHSLTQRTLREARAIGSLSHPHVITLYDILVVDDRPSIVMELLRARPLSAVILESRTLSPVRTAQIGAAVAAALREAHRAGITHRDVKPGNVLVADDGRVKLTDFGIARGVDDETMTSTGLLMGSPAYISPEVAGGAPATPLSDAWGLGGLLFACVQGRPPFDKVEAIATLTSVVSDPVPPHPRSGPLGGVIDALLQKDPDRRMNVRDAHELLANVALQSDGDRPTDGLSADRPRAAGAPVRPVVATLAQAAPVPPHRDRTVGRTGAPPPPWATGSEGSAGLAALPTVAPPNPRPRWTVAAALLVAILVAVVGYFGVRLMWDLGAHSDAAPSTAHASMAPLFASP